uniref:Iron-binding zinc finger CDGSH type domain-containing protein n=1 Tax=Plectus sambesii TaxID=2011161 RepID=A0A914VGC7_9BILA
MFASKCGQHARLLHTSVARMSDSSITVKGGSDVLPWKAVGAVKKPVKVHLEKGKTYKWCSCGNSANQPWCDNSHKRQGVTNLRPVEFVAEKDCDKWMCMCKQTDTRPFCDSTHKKVDKTPGDNERSRYVSFVKSPVYEGVAHKLGYKVKDGEQ